MSISGFVEQVNRRLKRLVKRNVKKASAALRKKPEEKDEIEIPIGWVKPKAPVKSSGSKPGEYRIKKGHVVVSSRKVYHWPWLKNLKRALAAILLLINFVFTQFLLISSGLQFASLLFFGNCLILIDYLWKTRGEAA